MNDKAIKIEHNNLSSVVIYYKKFRFESPTFTYILGQFLKGVFWSKNRLHSIKTRSCCSMRNRLDSTLHNNIQHEVYQLINTE